MIHEPPSHAAPGPFVLPQDHREELWVTFDASGALSGYADSITDPSGKTIYQRVQLVNGALIDTDVASGESHTSKGFNITPDGLRANVATAFSQILALQNPGAPAPHAIIGSTDTYVLSRVNKDGSTYRVYLDATSFRPVSDETVAVDGSALNSSVYEAFEVLTPGVDATVTAPLATEVSGTPPPVASTPPVSGVTCCSLQLDLDPTTPGVQSSLAIKDAQDIDIDIVLGDNVGNFSAFNFTLIYDDTLLTPAGENGGGLKGNPDFNEAALGTAWSCSSGGSPSPDVDPAKGTGHGAALLSCYALAGGTSVTTPTVIGTLRLHAAAPVAASVELADVSFAHDDFAEIGSCNPVVTTEMTCAGGSLVTP
ncbi:MAG: hypothetical protein M3P30_10890 [Chloroflexota bacterium]|nr:hypothetical protein [Chloroflexota bacterium]